MSCRCAHCSSVLDDATFGAELLALWGISAKQTRVLKRLIDGQGTYVTMAQLIHATYGHLPDGGPLTADKAIGHAIWALRKRIAHTAYSIECLLGFGYRLNRDPARTKPATKPAARRKVTESGKKRRLKPSITIRKEGKYCW